MQWKWLFIEELNIRYQRRDVRLILLSTVRTGCLNMRVFRKDPVDKFVVVVVVFFQILKTRVS